MQFRQFASVLVAALAYSEAGLAFTVCFILLSHHLHLVKTITHTLFFRRAASQAGFLDKLPTSDRSPSAMEVSRSADQEA